MTKRVQQDKQVAEKAADLRRAKEDLGRERGRAKVQATREALTMTLDEATLHYNGVKRARRLMRALGRSSSGEDAVVWADTYDQQMRAINDHQLAFEMLCRHIDTRPDLFSKPETLNELFRNLEGYLSQLITEFEDVRPTFDGDPLSCDLARLPRLSGFLASGALDPFSKPFGDMQRALRRDIQATFAGDDDDVITARDAAV